jgi:hypothetical protein
MKCAVRGFSRQELNSKRCEGLSREGSDTNVKPNTKQKNWKSVGVSISRIASTGTSTRGEGTVEEEEGAREKGSEGKVDAGKRGRRRGGV